MSLWQAERTLEDVERRIDIEKALDAVTPRERRVVSMRYGLDGQGGCTFTAIGEIEGVGCGRISQIEAKAFRKIRYSQGPKYLKHYEPPFLFWSRATYEERRKAKEAIEQKKRQDAAAKEAEWRRLRFETFCKNTVPVMAECPVIKERHEKRYAMQVLEISAAFEAKRAMRQAAYDRVQREIFASK